VTALRAVWSGITWRRVGLVLALGQLDPLQWSVGFQFPGVPFGKAHLEFAAAGVYSLLLLPVALYADEAMRRGARPGYVYAATLLINPVLGCMVACLVLRLYCFLYAIPLPEPRWGFLIAGIDFSVFGALGLMAFFYRRAAVRIVENLRGAELRRVELDRQLVESRLATAEAQVDPQMLFSALAQVKRSLQEGVPEAAGRLDELIQTLRAALTRAVATTSGT
jgi:hypothetical protein